jgi:DNA-binding ferritin-like protein (Dps family)
MQNHRELGSARRRRWLRGQSRSRRERSTQHLTRKTSFQPEEVEELAATYEQILHDLGLTKRSDLLTRMLAREVIELAEQGVYSGKQLTELVTKEWAPFRTG